MTFSPIFGNGRELEREKRKTPHSLYDLRRSGGRNPLSQDFKVYLLDEGYAWILITHNFAEDFVFGEEKL